VIGPETNYRTQAGYRLAVNAYRRALDNWPAPSQQQAVPTRIGQTFVLSWGEPSSPPLVLLHGSAANSSSWGMDAKRFASVFRVHAIDLPGETGKSTGLRPPYAGSAYPDWLSDVFDALQLRSTSIAGLSLGGWLGLKFAAAHPERVVRLALLAPGGVAPARKSFMLKAAFYRPFGKWGIQRVTNMVFAPHQAPPGAAEGFAFMLRHYRARRDTLPLITDEELSRVTPPVFLLGGGRDGLLDMASTDARLARLLPDYTSVVDPNAGHALIGKGETVMEFLCRGLPVTTAAPSPAAT
jgi:pimeloyl-ACP methyl ester carboxylesterase